MRTTIDLDVTILEQLRERQRREGKTLGQVANELLAGALAGAEDQPTTPLRWTTGPMGARVDLDDRDAVERFVDGGR